MVFGRGQKPGSFSSRLLSTPESRGTQLTTQSYFDCATDEGRRSTISTLSHFGCGQRPIIALIMEAATAAAALGVKKCAAFAKNMFAKWCKKQEKGPLSLTLQT